MRTLGDPELVDLCLRRDQEAWREFVRRFEPVLRHQVGRTLSRARQTVMGSDAVDDVIGDLYLQTLEGNMRKLRVWYQSERKAALASWLSMIATGIAIDHWRRASVRCAARSTLRDQSDEADRDPNRGGTWIEIQDRVLGDPPQRRAKRRQRG
jgi:DNA-directed RNA polymerase specialized sigma24 family protein